MNRFQDWQGKKRYVQELQPFSQSPPGYNRTPWVGWAHRNRQRQNLTKPSTKISVSRETSGFSEEPAEESRKADLLFRSGRRSALCHVPRGNIGIESPALQSAPSSFQQKDFGGPAAEATGLHEITPPKVSVSGETSVELYFKFLAADARGVVKDDLSLGQAVCAG